MDAFKTVLDHEVHKVESRLEEFGDLLKRLKVKCKSSEIPGKESKVRNWRPIHDNDHNN